MITHPREAARRSAAVLIAMLCAACTTGQRDAEAEPPRSAAAEPAPATTSEQSPNDARIIVPDHFIGAGVRIPDVDAGAVVVQSTSGQAGFCLDRPGRVTIDDIQPDMSMGSMRVEAFALVPRNATDGGSRIPLSRKPIIFDRAVDCMPDDPHARSRGAAMTDLRVQVRKIGEETAVAEQLIVRYTSGGHPYEFSFRYGIALCSPVDDTTRHCRPPE
ncbi:hypothetical protein ACLQ26_13815 [Micromonospora sp. DT43]|uniref:hypothetical protein n=1 Tax=Micromonospora sp. DT43 TaxID=3393440 RepID=UPI003CF0E677